MSNDNKNNTGLNLFSQSRRLKNIKLIPCSSLGTTANSSANVCSASNSSTGACSETSPKKNYEGYYSMLLLGNALVGIGAVPSFTLGLTYIEENSKVRSSPFYFGNLNCN